MVKITIEVDGQEPQVVRYAHFDLVQEGGLRTIYRAGKTDPEAIEPNGYARMTIRAWNGGTTFEDFIGREMITLLPKGVE